MLRAVLDARAFVAMVFAAIVGVWGLHTHPLARDNVFLALVELQNPRAFTVLAFGYATCWFTTPYFLASFMTSMLAIVAYHRLPLPRMRRLPPYPLPERRSKPSLILGESHLGAM